ncbi:VanZ family protein [Streptomyces sp. NBC_01178]|uniref:VanZ family protein n=1 Tax=Streptomyces sp. NBC_01178 TaxID=2903762 RepID=UPI0038638355|nr:VanZ family protein [Streptomyces sp. NBC_01178]
MTAEANPPVRRGTWVRVLVRGAVLVVALLGMVAFSVLLAKVTLTPSPASEDLVTSNLRPGRSLRQYAEDYTFLAACKQAGGNLLLGVPFGLLLPFFVPRRLRMIRTTLLTAVVMAVVELIQGALVAGRAFDIDDVILNTAGALLGYFLLGRRISHRYYVYTEDTVAPDASGEPVAEAERPAGAGPGRGAVAKPGAGPDTRSAAARTGTGLRARLKPAPTASARGTGTKRLLPGRGADGPDGDGRQAPAPKSARTLLDRFRRR